MQNILATFLQQDQYENSQTTYADTTSLWHQMSDALHMSLNRVLTLLIAILPGILAFIVALVVFTLIGVVVSLVLRRGLTAARFDDRLAIGRGNVEWAPSTSPTALVGRVSFWACVLIGLIIGVSAFDASYATAATRPSSLLPYFTHVVGAVFLLITGTLSARYLGRSVLIGAVNAQIQYARFLSLGVKWLVLVFTWAMVLGHLQIGGHMVELAFGILFGGIVLTLALAAGLGSRNLVSRSLEDQLERASERSASPPVTATNAPGDSIQHL